MSDPANYQTKIDAKVIQTTESSSECATFAGSFMNKKSYLCILVSTFLFNRCKEQNGSKYSSNLIWL
jgi:hypothetical protein